MREGYTPVLKLLSDMKSKGKEVPMDEKVTFTLGDLLGRNKPVAEGIQVEEKPKLASVDNSKIIKVSKEAVKEALTFRKNIDKVVKRLKVLDSLVKEITKVIKSKDDPKKQILKIKNIIAAQGDAYKLKEAELEEGSILGTTDDLFKATYKSTKNIALLTGLIAAIASPQIREELLGFIKGFLKQLGVTEGQLKSLTAAIGVTVGLLGAYFTYSALKPVVTVFEKMRELAGLLGLAAQEVDVNDKRVKREDNELRRKRKKTAKRLSALKKIKTIISNAVKLLKASFVGALIGVAIDVVGGTVIDISTTDPDVDINPVNIFKIAYNNLIESLFLGKVLNKLELEKSTDVQEDGNEEIYRKLEGKGSSNTSRETAPPAATTSNQQAAPVQSTPVEPSLPATPEEVNIQKTIVPQATEGASIESKSRELVQEENDYITRKNSTIVLVDNTQNIFVSPEESSPSFGSAYSVGVGR